MNGIISFKSQRFYFLVYRIQFSEKKLSKLNYHDLSKNLLKYFSLKVRIILKKIVKSSKLFLNELD